MQCRACMQIDCVGALEMNCVISADGKTLFDYFNDCTQLHATTSDNLPKLLCLNCTQNVQLAYNFKEIARRSDEELKKILLQPKTEPELIYVNTEQQQDTVECTNDPLATIPPAAIESLISMPELDIPSINIKSEKTEKYEELVFEESQDEEKSDDEVLRGRVSHPCKLCDSIYTTQKELKKHTFDLHKAHIICIKCPKVFDLPNELQLHEFLVHETESPVQCPWCKEDHQREDFYKHLRSKHGNSYSKYFPRKCIRVRSSSENTSFPCEHCEQHFSSVLDLADHIQEHTFDCPICSMRFKKHGSFRSHVKRIHNRSISSLKTLISEKKENKPFHCSLCLGQFHHKRSLYDHMKRKHNQSIKKPEDNEEDKLFNCPICNMCFRSHSAVYSHKRRKHPDVAKPVEGDVNGSGNIENEDSESSELVRCSFCNKEIPSNQIKYHEKRHMNRKRKYLCSFCPREYNSETSVKLHEKKIHLHEKPEPKECPICQKKVDPHYLKHHINNVHTSERRSVCDVCGDSFKSYVLLHSHKRLHLERNFPCTVCPKKFTRSSDLKVHMRIHTGEEPYACHICDRRFKIKVRLSYHLQRHAGIKRKCNECGKEFNHAKQLKIHSYKHTGMPYRCSVCDYACAQRDVFRKHLLRIHDMTMTPDEYCAMFKANTGRNPHVKTLEELQSEAQNMDQEELSN